MKKQNGLKDVSKPATKGRVKILYALPYMGCMVYLMQVDGDLFNSFSVINGQIYHFYVEMTPAKGKKKLSKAEIDKVVQILLAGAHTSIEQKLGVKQSEKEAGQSAEVIKVAEEAFGKKKKKKLLN